MKPIILVIAGGAMLLLAIHQDKPDANNELSQSSKEHKLHVKVQEKKKDTEVLIHDINFWLARLQ
jgi:hypothetical protein